MKSMNVKHTDTFNTPQFLYNQLDNVFSFELDAACDSTNMKAHYGFRHDLGECGLEGNWGDRRVFCNPPFSQKDKWIHKAYKEVFEKACPVCVMILPLNCMSTRSFYDYVIKNNIAYEIIRGRVQFIDNDTKKTTTGNNSGSVIVYFKKPIRNRE